MGDRLATIDMGRKVGVLRPSLGAPSNNVALAEAYLRANWHLDPSIGRNRLHTWVENFRGLCPFVRSWVSTPHPTQCRLVRDLPL